MSAAINISNKRYGKLIALFDTGSKNKLRLWSCRCDCGNTTVVTAKDLRSGNTQSCGCYHKEKTKEHHFKSRVNKICKSCNISFYIKKSHSDKAGVYCSKTCMSLDFKTRLIKENNPNYKGGITFNNEYYNSRSKAYYKKNPELKKQLNRNIKAKRKMMEGIYTQKDVEWKLLIQKNKCYWCYEELAGIYHIDHVIPVSKGGSNWSQNIVPSCPACNLQKRNMLPEEWFLKSNCRAIRRVYETGRYSKGFGGESSNRILCLD